MSVWEKIVDLLDGDEDKIESGKLKLRLSLIYPNGNTRSSFRLDEGQAKELRESARHAADMHARLRLASEPNSTLEA